MIKDVAGYVQQESKREKGDREGGEGEWGAQEKKNKRDRERSRINNDNEMGDASFFSIWIQKKNLLDLVI